MYLKRGFNDGEICNSGFPADLHSEHREGLRTSIFPWRQTNDDSSETLQYIASTSPRQNPSYPKSHYSSELVY